MVAQAEGGRSQGGRRKEGGGRKKEIGPGRLVNSSLAPFYLRSSTCDVSFETLLYKAGSKRNDVAVLRDLFAGVTELLPAIENLLDLRCRNDAPCAVQVLDEFLEFFFLHAPPVFFPADEVVQEFHTRVKPIQVLLARCADQRYRLLFGHGGKPPVSSHVVVNLARTLAASLPAACSFVGPSLTAS